VVYREVFLLITVVLCFSASAKQQTPLYAMDSVQKIPNIYLVNMKNDAQLASKIDPLLASIIFWAEKYMNGGVMRLRDLQLNYFPCINHLE
jgi:hypothetical protein